MPFAAAGSARPIYGSIVVSRVSHTTINAGNAFELATWWKRVLHYVDPEDDPNRPGDDECMIVDPDSHHRLLFIEVDDLQGPDGRIHLDLAPTDRGRDEEVERVVALGARLVADRRAGDGTGWVVLADPAGNRFCILRRDDERRTAEAPREPERSGVAPMRPGGLREEAGALGPAGEIPAEPPRVDRAPEGVAVRAGTLDDAPVLRALYRRSASTNDSGRRAFAARAELAELAEPSDEHLLAGRARVAVEGTRILGFAVIVPTEGGAAELDALFVEPDAMGRGIGRALVTDVVAVAVGSGTRRLDVVAASEAVAFYQRCGFERRGATSTEFGLAQLMTRRLDR